MAIVEGPFQSITSLTAISLAVSGTITSSTSESDIVSGGKTIALTLSGASWVAASLFDAVRQSIIDLLISNQSESTGWNAEVRDNLDVSAVVRTSDQVVTITLSAQSGYDIIAAEAITPGAPAAAVDAGILVSVESEDSFTISPVAGFCDGSDIFDGTAASFGSNSNGESVRLDATTWDKSGIETDFPVSGTAILSGAHVVCVDASSEQQWDLDGCTVEWRAATNGWAVWYPVGATGQGSSELFFVFREEQVAMPTYYRIQVFQGNQTTAASPSDYFSNELGITVPDPAYYNN